jgi:hypothetical protein
LQKYCEYSVNSQKRTVRLRRFCFSIPWLSDAAKANDPKVDKPLE